MARILLADADDGIANLERILTPGHEFVAVQELHTALEALEKQSYDLIIVGVHFDDSRMFDLLPHFTKIKTCAETPVICFCTRDTPITRAMHESLEFSARALGAWMYLDQHEYNGKLDPDAELRRIIDRCLTDAQRKAALEKSADIQLQREDIHRLREALVSEVWTLEQDNE